jgi:P-type Ca2+ transporter type 2C
LQGLISLSVILFVFGWSLYRGDAEAAVRTLTFATLVLCMVGLILVNRSHSQNFWRTLRLPNRAFWWVTGGTLGFLAAVIYIPQAREIFRFAELDLIDLMIPLGAATLVVLCLEIAKRVRPKSASLPKI